MSNEPEWRNKRDLDEQSAMSKHYINSRLAIIFSTLVLICDTLLWTTQYNLDIEAELDLSTHGLRTPGEEIAFTARPKIHSHSQILGTAEAYFVCHIGPKFQISLIYVLIGCP